MKTVEWDGKTIELPPVPEVDDWTPRDWALWDKGCQDGAVLERDRIQEAARAVDPERYDRIAAELAEARTT